MAEVVEFGSPKGWEYTIGGEPQTWWRVPITNRKGPVDLTVRAASITPEVRLIVPNGRLHRMGNDPPDGKYAGVTTLQHDETVWFDVISMSPRVPGFSGSGGVVTNTSSSNTQIYWSGGKTWPMAVDFCIRTVDRPDYRMPVELDGTYDITLSAHFGSKSRSRTYRLEADAQRRVLTMSDLAKSRR